MRVSFELRFYNVGSPKACSRCSLLVACRELSLVGTFSVSMAALRISLCYSIILMHLQLNTVFLHQLCFFNFYLWTLKRFGKCHYTTWFTVYICGQSFKWCSIHIPYFYTHVRVKWQSYFVHYVWIIDIFTWD